MPEKDIITQSESMALSMIRVFAMTLIVACHIAQYYELQIAWVLNVGVQVFFYVWLSFWEVGPDCVSNGVL